MKKMMFLIACVLCAVAGYAQQGPLATTQYGVLEGEYCEQDSEQNPEACGHALVVVGDVADGYLFGTGVGDGVVHLDEFVAVEGLVFLHGYEDRVACPPSVAEDAVVAEDIDGVVPHLYPHAVAGLRKRLDGLAA